MEVSFKNCLPRTSEHRGAILQDSSHFRRSGFQSLQCSTTLIPVKNISRINCLDRRVSIAPMMDWSDEVNIRKDLNYLERCRGFRLHFVSTLQQ